jgi:tRNA(Ile)-lysidine synthase
LAEPNVKTMLHLDKQTLAYLQNKNLLAFSAGVDSTALFFLLLQNRIDFDIALVNYQTRSSSDEEEAYAKALAQQYNKKCYTLKAPTIEHNFEKKARDIRYTFFEEIVQTKGYDTLITAHQLNDQFEWFLMQLSKGAGVSELIGLQNITKRPNYSLIRPILHHSKEELVEYLNTHNHHYFIDESNFDEQYKRNHFRKHFSDKFLDQYLEGVRRSLTYLHEDKQTLQSSFYEIYRYKKLVILHYHHPSTLPRAVDFALKSLGYLMSHAQRESIKEQTSLVIGGVWTVEVTKKHIFIAPYRNTIMPKVYKELCRVHQIPQKIRAYCYEEALLPYILRDVTIL